MKPLVTLTDEQNAAAQQIREFIAAPSSHRQTHFTMHGLAGTGKTSVLSHLAYEYPTAWLCALAGKAADVLRRKTGLDAQTIHSAFYKLKKETLTESGKRDLEFSELHGEDDLHGRIVFVDECSQIPTRMAQDMLRTGVKLIACGDPGQLPPVSGEAFFAKPDVTLRTIHRQALESPIIRQAHQVRSGKGYEPDGDGFQVTTNARDHIVDAGVVLCWKNDTRHKLNAIIRRRKGFTSPFIQTGEPVMCLKNCPDHGVFNGGIYTLAHPFKEGDTKIIVDVDGYIESIKLVKFENMKNAIPAGMEETSFALAYASTVHKFQGSEEDKIVLIDEYARSDDRNKWLYTGITRAAKQCIVMRT